MYVFAPNQEVETYPYSIGLLRRDNPQTSFPSEPSLELLAEWNVFPVTATTPSFDPLTEDASEGIPQLVDGEWTQSWEITTVAPEVAQARRKGRIDYQGFYLGLLGSSAYSAIREQAKSSLALTVACTEFIAAFSMVKSAPLGPSVEEEAVLQAAIDGVFGEATLDAAKEEEISSLLSTFFLDTTYTLPFA